MDEKLIPDLQALGLSDKEARVYLSALSLGYSTVSKIGQRAGIKRVTTYVILDSLIQKGLISQITKQKKTFFVAEEPSNLRRLLDRSEKELSNKKEKLDSVMPKLREIHELPAERPEVRFYTGKEGIKTVIANTLKEARGSKDVIYGMIDLEKVFNIISPDELTEHSQRRVKLGVKSRVFYSRKQPPHSPLREQKYVPDNFPIRADITFFKNKLFVISYETEKPVGVVIEEPHIAQTFRSLFEMAWECMPDKTPPKGL